jgi:hypothetical protein
MRLAIYVQQKLYKIIDLGSETKRYNYGKIASEISHEINQGLMENYNPAEHFQLQIVPVN